MCAAPDAMHRLFVEMLRSLGHREGLAPPEDNDQAVVVEHA